MVLANDQMRGEKMNLIQTESTRGSHGLLTYASTSCYGGNPTLTTPCPKVKKDEKDAKNKTREGFKKTYSEKVWVFAKPGGGVSEGGEKTKLLF